MPHRYGYSYRITYGKHYDFFQVFIKSELKVGVVFVKEGQYNEEEILDNNENSFLFNEFLSILGETVVLKGTYRIYSYLLLYA